MTACRLRFTTMAGLWWIFLVGHCFLTFCFAKYDNILCGPGSKCTCTHVGTKSGIKMDCGGTKLTISDVCKVINNTARIVNLNMNYNIIRTINQSDLLGCNKLHQICLSNCELTNIDVDSFSEMKELTDLDMSDNPLQYLYEGNSEHFLEHVKRLQLLSLRILISKYENRTLSYPDLSALSNLNTLELDGLGNTGFPEEYASLTKLTTLTLSGCKRTRFCNMSRLSEKTFQNVSYVKTLDISCCMITSVDLGTFKRLPSLEWLDISQNRGLGFEPCSNISYGLQFTNIDFLNYSYNDNTFGLGQIITKEDICFLRNTSLRELVVDGMRLELLETNALILFPAKLEIIRVKDNHFTFGPYLLQLPCMGNIKEIELSFQNQAHNPLHYTSEIHHEEAQCRRKEVHPYCPFLEESYLVKTSLSIENCEYFRECPSYSTFWYINIPKGLRHAIASDCSLTYDIPNLLLNPLDNVIESVDFSGNLFHGLYGPIGPVNALKSIQLGRNYCRHIEHNFFYYMTNLTSLDLQINLLGKLLDNHTSALIFKPLTQLQSLNLSHNQIKQLAPNVFSYLTSLETLDLSYNSIDAWTIDTNNLPKLRNLSLGFNSLATLPDYLTQQFELHGVSFTIDLRHNPLIYSCAHKTFLKWMAKHEVSFVAFDEYIFHDENGKLMNVEKFRQDIKDIDKLCRSYTVAILICSVGITIFLTAVVAGLVYKNRWKLRYFLYMNKLRFSGYRSSYEPLEHYTYDAFVSYADQNSEFRDAIIKNLEADVVVGTSIKLCVHERDFTPGRPIAENIIGAIQNSNKTIIALSKAYLNSKWCLHEFHMARLESIYSRSGKSIIIVVMLEDVPLDNKMPLEVMQWLRQDSYLEYTTEYQGQVLFWNKLRESIIE